MNSASLNEIAYNILNTIREGRSSNTENISLDQVKFAVKYYRSLLIRRDMWRNNNRFRMFEQDLGHVPVSTIDTAEDPSISSANIILRTDNQIPTPIRMKEFEGITHVGSTDKSRTKIPILDTQRSYWEQFSKYTASSSHATYRGGYIYVFNDLSLQTINIRGIFEDPEEVHKFTRANGLDLYDDDSPFPVPSDMIQQITQSILNTEMSAILKGMDDDEHNFQQDETE